MLWLQPQPCTWSLLTSMKLLLGALPCQLQHSPVLLPFLIINERLSISTPKPVVALPLLSQPCEAQQCACEQMWPHTCSCQGQRGSITLPSAPSSQNGHKHAPGWELRLSYCAPGFPKPFVTGLLWSLCLRHCLATLQRSHRLLLRALRWCCWIKQVMITRRREKRNWPRSWSVFT